eukprot:TRINITY_DN3714_c0_g2_i4.p1 TRINITY_DN3714_c0_g2~~TRINITY_DN3714_c0_g2_i4.p1  ORF type:complete len:138 (-),score=20.82 TRINITY_DN3714_c0_g2_i4:72-485(-)
MTILTDLSSTAPRPVFAQIREETNTQWDFVMFVCDAIDVGHLCPGDILIADNASIHKGDDSFDILLWLLKQHQVTLVFLPKYSPELNPCEFVFGKLKNHLYNYRKSDDFFWELAKAMAKISIVHVWKFYLHCRWEFK